LPNRACRGSRGRTGAASGSPPILVATSEEKLAQDDGDLWDTGKVASDQSIQVPYEGKPMRSGLRAYWKVRVWDRDGRASPWSPVAFWEMGLLAPDDWKARWISAVPSQAKQARAPAVPGPLFRKAFTLNKPIRSARAYVCGLGYYEFHLNGRKVGDHVLDPAFTRYDRRVLYVTHDITPYLKPGPNAAGFMLGNGWYNMFLRCTWDFDKAPWRSTPAVRAEIRVDYADGTSETLCTDESWKVRAGPVVFDCIRSGETYDARLERPDWDRPECDEREWASAHVVDGPKDLLSAQQMPPIRVTETIVPVKSRSVRPGVAVFDMGQNFAGWARLSVSGPPGAKVVLKYGERLNPDGTVSQKEIAAHAKEGAFQTDTYVLKGQGVEEWEPRFVYHGFQYVEVSGLVDGVTLHALRGRVVHTAFEPAGRFECSNELLRLPTPREKRLDRRRPLCGAAGDVQLGQRRRLYEVDGGLPGRAARQRRTAGNRADERVGLPVGQRSGVGQRILRHPVAPVHILRRHAHPRTSLRPNEALRGLPHEQGRQGHRLDRPGRLGAGNGTHARGGDVHRVLLL